MPGMILLFLLALIIPMSQVQALERPELEFKIFQFPADMIPDIDGKTDDWDIVGEEYTYGTDLLNDTKDGHGTNIDPKDKDVKVRIGWVKGINSLYFLYEAYDDYWDFGRFDGKGYKNDLFEIAVDADLSGGQFINNPQIKDGMETFFRFSGAHAQNYHIQTPPVNNQWGWSWGGQPWICYLPWTNQAYDYDFKHGESGNLVLEFWITPFDYASYDGPERSVVSKLTENSIIGLSWSVLDFDGGKRDGHYNLSHTTKMVSDASYLCAFRLMPVEKRFQPVIEARWSFRIIDMDQRLVYFKDESIGKVTKRRWHFGNGDTSTEQYPIYQFKKPGRNTVWLEVEGPEGKSCHSKHKEILIK